jgi:hypothetical protein
MWSVYITRSINFPIRNIREQLRTRSSGSQITTRGQISAYREILPLEADLVLQFHG